MQERGERTRIDHQPGSFSVNRTIDIQIVTIADLNRNSPQSAPIETRKAAEDGGIGVKDEQLPLTIQHRLRREKNVRANDPVDLLFMSESRGASGIAEIDSNHWLIDQSQCSDPQLTRDRNVVEPSVYLNARG